MEINLRAAPPGRAGTVLAAIALLAGCVSQKAPPPPRVAPRPVAVALPTAPPPVARPPADWRDRPLTAGDWSYAAVPGGSVARYGAGASSFAITCNPARRTVTLSRVLDGAAPAGTIPVTIITTLRPRPFSAALSTDPASARPALAIAFAARDPMLDEIAFSRGRFAIEASGEPTLILPAWEEVGRVIEDCR